MLLIADHKELLHRGTRSIPLPLGRTKANGIFRSELRPATDGLAGHYDTPVLATSSQLHACSARIGYTVRLQSHDNGRGNGSEPAWHSFGGVFDTPSSECFDGQRKYVANAAFGQDDARRVWIGLQLAPQAQYLNVDTAIEDIFVDAGCLQKVLAGERSLRSIEKRNQKRVFALGHRNRDSAAISQAPDAPVKLPAAQ